MSAVLDLDQIACSGNGVVSESWGEATELQQQQRGAQVQIEVEVGGGAGGCCCLLQQPLEVFSSLSSTWSLTAGSRQ